MLGKINILSWVPKLMCGGVGIWQSASTVSKGKMRGLRVQGTLKIKFDHYCDALNLYIKYQLGTWWTDSHVWKNWELTRNTGTFSCMSLLCFCNNESNRKPYLRFRNSFLKFPVLPEFCVPLLFSFFVEPAAHMLCCKAKPTSVLVSWRSMFTTALLGEDCCRLPSTSSVKTTAAVLSADTECFPSAWHDCLWLCFLGNPVSRLLDLSVLFIVLLMYSNYSHVFVR